MAQLILKGLVANIKLTFDPENGQTIATCIGHRRFFHVPSPGNCDWTERYDTLDDADRGTR